MSTLSVAWANALTRKGINTSSIKGIDAVHPQKAKMMVWFGYFRTDGIREWWSE
jgi:hypothetical protein